MFQIRLWFPGVFTRRVIFPFDEELHLSVSFSMSDDHFYFPFFLSFDKVRCWKEVVRAVRVILLVWGEKAGVEYGVDFSLGRKVQLVRKRSKDFHDRERALSFHGQLFVVLEKAEVLRFQPDLLTLFEGFESPSDPLRHVLSCELVRCHRFLSDFLQVVETFFDRWYDCLGGD